MAQKTGADAIFVATRKICHILIKYSVKLRAFIDSQVVAGNITSAQATTAKAWLDLANAACDVFDILAGFNSV